MIVLLLIALIGLALVYGAFFLIFKLIWVLCKSKRNLWPLILAGVSTLLLVLMTVIATVRTYNAITKPFAPIMAAIESNTAPQTGSRVFSTDDWSMRVYNGMTFSDKIEWGDITGYVGVDVNMFRKNVPEKDKELHLLGVVKADMHEPVSAKKAHQLTLNMLKQDGRVQVKSTTYSADGQTQIVIGQAYARQGAIDFILLTTAKGDNIYYVGALGQGAMIKEQESLKSFQVLDD